MRRHLRVLQPRLCVVAVGACARAQTDRPFRTGGHLRSERQGLRQAFLWNPSLRAVLNSLEMLPDLCKQARAARFFRELCTHPCLSGLLLRETTSTVRHVHPPRPCATRTTIHRGLTTPHPVHHPAGGPEGQSMQLQPRWAIECGPSLSPHLQTNRVHDEPSETHTRL